jgi:hypothetical protein
MAEGRYCANHKVSRHVASSTYMKSSTIERNLPNIRNQITCLSHPAQNEFAIPSAPLCPPSYCAITVQTARGTKRQEIKMQINY